MIVLVCGGRGFGVADLAACSNWAEIQRARERAQAERDFGRMALDVVRDIHGADLVVHGAAPGADTLADEWARDRGAAVDAMPADWKGLGRAAGPMRNRSMAEKYRGRIDLVVAFPGGTGTDDMVKVARGEGFNVMDLRDWRAQ